VTSQKWLIDKTLAASTTLLFDYRMSTIVESRNISVIFGFRLRQSDIAQQRDPRLEKH
jgi:hypothetical protein